MPEVSTVESLTTQTLTEYFKRIHTRTRIVGKGDKRIGVKNSTIKTHRSKLNAFFTWLEKKDYISENPFSSIPAPQVSYEDYKRLEDSDVHKIYSAITSYSGNSFLTRRDNCMVSLLLYCGIRKGEFIGLHVRDIDIEKRELTIRGETSKSKTTRVVKMHISLVTQMKDYMRERNILGLKTEWLIASSKADRGLTAEGLKHWVKSLVKKSGVKFHLHQFRHTFACKLVESNVNLFKIQKLMGHLDIKMTMKYVRSIKTENMEEDINKISFS